MSSILGLVELAVYVCSILALSSAVTYAVVRISPSQSAKQSPEKT